MANENMYIAINPRIDLVFKKLFGVEENKDLLKSLINSIVAESDQVEDLTLLNPYNIQNLRTDKLSILDIKAKGVNGKFFNIEMQITDTGDYDKRALYYWAKLYTDQLKTGEQYSELSKVIGIHILNFFSIPQSEAYHNVFHVTEKRAGFQYFEDFELHTIELKKFEGAASKVFNELIPKIKTALDLWVAFLTKHELLAHQRLPQGMPEQKQINKALNILEIMNFDDYEREAYDSKMKWFMDENAALQKAANEGRTEGFIEGHAKGRVEGNAEGSKERAYDIARTMLGLGEKPIKIAQITKLTLQELEELCE